MIYPRYVFLLWAQTGRHPSFQPSCLKKKRVPCIVWPVVMLNAEYIAIICRGLLYGPLFFPFLAALSFALVSGLIGGGFHPIFACDSLYLAMSDIFLPIVLCRLSSDHLTPLWDGGIAQLLFNQSVLPTTFNRLRTPLSHRLQSSTLSNVFLTSTWKSSLPYCSMSLLTLLEEVKYFVHKSEGWQLTRHLAP